MKGTLLFAQSGGPTAVINASAYGVFREAFSHDEITKVYAARFGIDGVLAEDFVDVGKIDEREIEKLRQTPGAAFGSCRHKLPKDQGADEYAKILAIFKKYDVRYFVYNGGNDSMDTCNKIASYFAASDYDCKVVGVPKTVDNDLACTDHCPGFGSAAKFVATVCHEIAIDTAVYAKGRVTIVEIMGRDAGWLTASAALATAHGAGPDLVYLPETPFDFDGFVAQCKKVLESRGRCLVALSEGVRTSSGDYVGATSAVAAADGFKHAQLGGVASRLADKLTSEQGLKTRAIELSLLQRCAGHLTSATDVSEAEAAGAEAVKAALAGKTNVMISFERVSNDPYRIVCRAVCLDDVANAVKTVPPEFYDEQNACVTKEGVAYLAPLIQGENFPEFDDGLPVYSRVHPRMKV